MPQFEVTSTFERLHLLHGDKANRLQTERVQARTHENAAAIVKSRKEKQTGEKVHILSTSLLCRLKENCGTCAKVSSCNLVTTLEHLKKELPASVIV